MSKSEKGHEKEHARTIGEVAEELGPVLECSEQSVYIYLDDINKVCNRNFALLLGYRSPNEWAGIQENFPDAFVAKKSQKVLISAYQDSITRFAGSKIAVTWKRKDGKEVDTTVIMVPFTHGGHAMALHFIEKKVRGEEGAG